MGSSTNYKEKLEFAEACKANKDVQKFINEFNIDDVKLWKYSNEIYFFINQDQEDYKIGIEYIEGEIKIVFIPDGLTLKSSKRFSQYTMLGFSRSELVLGWKDINKSLQEQIKEPVGKLLKDWPNVRGLFIHGTMGIGKSHICKVIGNLLADKEFTISYVFWPDFIQRLKLEMGKEDSKYGKLINDLKTCDFLVIDDLGAEVVSTWSRDEVLLPIINKRFDNKQPICITSNLNPKDLESHLNKSRDYSSVGGKRIMDRLNGMSTVIKLTGENLREW